MPVDPAFAVRGAEWSVGGLGGAAIPGIPGAGATDGAAKAGTSFGGVLADQIGALEKLQTDAATGSQALAAGNADPTEVVMAVERARLGMQLASQIRNKAVEAVQDIFHTQV